MTFSFHPEAETELFGAMDWYEEQEPDLGPAFAEEATAAFLRISDFPEAWPVLTQDLRRCLLHRFPFGVIYSIEQDEILILAVMHLHRDPGYWESRRP